MKKVMVVFGTRPEAIKMCPVIKELKDRQQFETVVCVTGQHKQMLKQVLEVFDITPDHDLQIMSDKQTLFDVSIRVLDGMKDVLELERPDVVLVHGDTSTAFFTALACFYMKIPVGHVEAGLRTYDMYSPFPEEFNRESIDLIAQYLFAPTELSKQNLITEKHNKDHIYVTGNTVIDALALTVRVNFRNEVLDWVADSRMILVTAHRRENIGEPMRNMFRAIKKICEEYSDIKVVYPIHMNPTVRDIAQSELCGNERIRIIEPLDVLDFHNFMNNSYLILTDSGGIQEEAPALGKPVLVMRNTTERPEGVEAGTLKLVGTSEKGVYDAFKLLLDNEFEYKKMSESVNPYGDGKASKRIVDILERQLL